MTTTAASSRSESPTEKCAAALRVDGFEVFVPHEHELAALRKLNRVTAR
jgi:hypothetical protein